MSAQFPIAPVPSHTKLLLLLLLLLTLFYYISIGPPFNFGETSSNTDSL